MQFKGADPTVGQKRVVTATTTIFNISAFNFGFEKAGARECSRIPEKVKSD